MPNLCMAGEADELSPLEHTERLMKTLAGPKRLVVYQDARHAIFGVPAANRGPDPAVPACAGLLLAQDSSTVRAERCCAYCVTSILPFMFGCRPQM